MPEIAIAIIGVCVAALIPLSILAVAASQRVQRSQQKLIEAQKNALDAKTEETEALQRLIAAQDGAIKALQRCSSAES